MPLWSCPLASVFLITFLISHQGPPRSAHTKSTAQRAHKLYGKTLARTQRSMDSAHTQNASIRPTQAAAQGQYCLAALPLDGSLPPPFSACWPNIPYSCLTHPLLTPWSTLGCHIGFYGQCIQRGPIWLIKQLIRLTEQLIFSAKNS